MSRQHASFLFIFFISNLVLQMLFGPRYGAFFIVNSFGTSLVELCKIQEAFSEFSSPVAAFNFLIFR